MLIQTILTFFLLTLIFIITKKISTSLYSSIYLVTRSRKVAVWILSLILLPGTVIHELSHFLIATILRVPTGHLTIFPTFEKSGEVKAGKIEIGKSDPFRLSIIGLAPMLVGLILIYIIGRIFFSDLAQILDTKYLILNTLGIYLLFSISITMFSSKRDLKSLLIAGPIVFLITASIYLMGVKIVFEETLMSKVVRILADLNFFLLLSAIIDLLILFITTLILQVLKKGNRK